MTDFTLTEKRLGFREQIEFASKVNLCPTCDAAATKNAQLGFTNLAMAIAEYCLAEHPNRCGQCGTNGAHCCPADVARD